MNDHETILLTGASGFIGSFIAERLLSEDKRVRCLVRPSSDTTRLRSRLATGDGPGLELAVGDLTNRASLASAAEGCAQVIHCAAMVSDWGTVREIRAANATGTAVLAAAAADAGARRFVHVSTTDVYGHPGGRGVSEDHVPSGFANWYAETKREAEAALLTVAAGSDLEVVILRPATVYGPRCTEVVGEMARAMRGRYLPLIDGGRPVAGLVHVENFADAALLALTHPEAVGEAFNVVDGLDTTWRQFLGDIGAGLGYPTPPIRLGYRLASCIGVSLEESYRVVRRLTGLHTPPLLTRAAVQVLGRDQDFSNAKLRARLGWEPRVDYQVGLAATLDWLRNDYLPCI